MGLKAFFQFSRFNVPKRELSEDLDIFEETTGTGPTTIALNASPGTRYYIKRVFFTNTTALYDGYLRDSSGRRFFMRAAALNETLEYDFTDNSLIFQDLIDFEVAGIGGGTNWGIKLNIIGEKNFIKE